MTYEQHITRLSVLLNSLVHDLMSENMFKNHFALALKDYEQFAGKRAYAPLPDLHNMTGEKLLKSAVMALERLPKEALNYATELWIRDSLRIGKSGDDYFSFDIFTDRVRLFATPVQHSSILVSALTGVIKPLPFAYNNLLQLLKNLSNNEPASWVEAICPENMFITITKILSFGHVYDEGIDWLSRLGTIDPRGQVQGGDCYQFLLPQSKRWMLVHFYDFSKLQMYLYGDNDFLQQVVASDLLIEFDFEVLPAIELLD